MDFVTAWKASSIVLTGAFGILGLIKEFKDKETGQITKWGRISLAGILLSSGLGVVAQLKESSSQEKARKATAEQTLALAQKTDQTVRDLQRILSPLNEPRISLVFEVLCDDSKYKALCADVRLKTDYISSLSMWKKWPGGSEAILSFHFYFFMDAKDAQTFIDGRRQESDLRIDIVATNYEKDKSFMLSRDPEDTGVHLDMFDQVPSDVRSNGRLKSVLDFPNTTMVLTELNNELSRLKLEEFDMRFKNGQEVEVKHFERITFEGRAAYRTILP